MATHLSATFTYDIEGSEGVTTTFELRHNVDADTAVVTEFGLRNNVDAFSPVQTTFEIRNNVAAQKGFTTTFGIKNNVDAFIPVETTFELKHNVAPASSVTTTFGLRNNVDVFVPVITTFEIRNNVDAFAGITTTFGLRNDVFVDITPATYVVNIETGAVSRYDNAEFNGFAVCGGVLYGIKEGGIYVIGDAVTDDGHDIIGEITTGLVDFGTSYKKQQVDAYFRGTSATNDLQVGVSMDGGREYTYPLRRFNGPIGIYKARFGKGLVGQYSTYRLFGTQFVCDDIEPRPHVFDRRV